RGNARRALVRNLAEFEEDLANVLEGRSARNNSAPLLEAAIQSIRKELEKSLEGEEEKPFLSGAAQQLGSSEFLGEELSQLATQERNAPPPTPECFKTRLDDEDPILPSEMDPIALGREDPIGRINPPKNDRVFICDEVRIPVPNGFLYDIALGEVPQERRLFEPILEETELPETELTIPFNAVHGRILPVPLDGVISFAPEEIPVSRPNDLDPMCWRTRGQRQQEVSFAVTQGSLRSLGIEAAALLTPLKEEQAYWMEALGVPQALEEMLGVCTTNKERLDICTYWMHGRDANSRLSNFRYVNHEAFGQFIRENHEDLSLITSELRVGHCDLLSWYGAALLRGAGIPAWVTTVRLPTNDGTAFNNSYLHSQVAYLDDNNTISVWDPTLRSDQDIAYAPEVLDARKVAALSEEFSRAASFEEKLVALRRFAKDQEVIRDTVTPTLESEPHRFPDLPNTLFVDYQSRSAMRPAHDALLIPATAQNWRSFDCPRDIYEALQELVVMTRTETAFSVSSGVALETVQFLPVVDRGKVALTLRLLKQYKLSEPLNCFESHRYDESALLLNQDDVDVYCGEVAMRLKGSHPLSIPGTAPRRLVTIDYEEAVALWRESQAVRSRDGVGSFLHLECATATVGVIPPRRERFTKPICDLIEKGYFPSYTDRAIAAISFRPGLKSPETFDFRETEYSDICQQVHEIQMDLQPAMVNGVARKRFLERAQISETDFRVFCEHLVNFDSKGSRGIGRLDPERLREALRWKPTTEPRFKTYTSVTSATELEPDCVAALTSSFKKVLRRLDTLAGRTAKVENDELRPYVPGDDVRKIDQKIFAKTNELFVREAPAVANAFSSPLHVLIDSEEVFSGSLSARWTELHLVELLKRDKRRQIYLAKTDGEWVHLSDKVRKLPAATILDSLPGRKHIGSSFALMLPNGKPPKNFLFLTSAYTRGLVVQETLTRCGSQAVSVWSRDAALQVWPQLRPDFIAGRR
ncbi:MAG: DUF58 domain-containing protein, partial [Bdellovibrionales bacterium]|nr:DUF58 domain-containing protein [Bdellovibrionales bacterium]